jgi:hypothetical protein
VYTFRLPRGEENFEKRRRRKKRSDIVFDWFVISLKEITYHRAPLYLPLPVVAACTVCCFISRLVQEGPSFRNGLNVPVKPKNRLVNDKPIAEKVQVLLLPHHSFQNNYPRRPLLS